MKRNSALFGASAAVGLTAAAGLIMTSATSSAASASPTFYGVAYSTTTATVGFKFGTIINPDFIFTATASQVGQKSVVAFKSELPGAIPVNVTTECADGAPMVLVNGKSYTKPTTLTAKVFTGNKYAVGNVTLLKAVSGGITVGAYYDLSAAGAGQYVEIGGVSGCTAATTTSTSSTSTTTGPTSTSTNPTGPTSTSTSTTTGPTSTSTNPTGPTSTSTSTTTGPTSTSTYPTSPTSSPTSTATQPPTPTATTTTLPVTG